MRLCNTPQAMQISIYSIQHTLYVGDAEKLIAKTPMGEISILENHLPIISKIIGPEVRMVDKNGESRIIKIMSGFLEVRPASSDRRGSHVVLLAEEGA